jgi:hypothetical protein
MENHFNTSKLKIISGQLNPKNYYKKEYAKYQHKHLQFFVKLRLRITTSSQLVFTLAHR